jgi:putative proteasome-type protease
MTYCVAMRLNAGVVFLSDSRTNAGVDHISTYRKMTVFERPGDRVLVLMSAGNLAITQSVRQLLTEAVGEDTLWSAPTMSKAASLVGDAIREVHRRDGASLREFGIDFNCSFILGGQISGEDCRLFNIYSAGNFIEAHAENPYFQIGEFKYGKPIVDRVITPETPLDVAAKCGLISMDSTLKSNISVGLPLDLLIYERDTLRISRFVTITQDNAYFNQIRSTWGKQLRHVFNQLPDPQWQEMPTADSWPVFEQQIRSRDQ